MEIKDVWWCTAGDYLNLWCLFFWSSLGCSVQFVHKTHNALHGVTWHDIVSLSGYHHCTLLSILDLLINRKTFSMMQTRTQAYFYLQQIVHKFSRTFSVKKQPFFHCMQQGENGTVQNNPPIHCIVVKWYYEKGFTLIMQRSTCNGFMQRKHCRKIWTSPANGTVKRRI